ncbi:hypothetical protein ACFWM0_26320 [Streptomyces sp. NPDC058405]|uniref:hypothetical protein n=1 Tax=unclassified Streptomyces TaxID=2593676 RepID=UPI0036480D5C
MTTVPSFFALATSSPEGSGQSVLTLPDALPVVVVSEAPVPPHAVAASATAAPADISFQLW